MDAPLEIKCLSQEEQSKILDKIEKSLTGKIKEGRLKEKDVREIEEMKLRPSLDIQDVQSVYADFMYRNKE